MSNIVPQPIPQKQCAKCNQIFPATSEYFHHNKRKKDGFHQQCKECKNDALKTYRSRPEIQEQARIYSKEYHNRPEVQERSQIKMKAYYSRTDVQERIQTYRNRPEIQEQKRNNAKVYQQRPEVKERARAYRDRPEIREKEQAQRKSYRSRPEVQEQIQSQRKTYKARPEVKEQARVDSRLRYARKKSVQGTYTFEQIQEQLKRQRHKCYYCQTKFKHEKGQYIYHIEHTFPLSRVAGTNIPANSIDYIVLACPPCNESKQDKFPWEWPKGGRLL